MGKTGFESFKPSLVFGASVLRGDHDQGDGFADSFRQDIKLGGSCFELLPLGFWDVADDLLLSTSGVATCSGRAGEVKGTDNGIFGEIDFVLIEGQFQLLRAHVDVGSGGCDWNDAAEAPIGLGLAELWPPFALESWLLQRVWGLGDHEDNPCFAGVVNLVEVEFVVVNLDQMPCA